MNPIPHPHRIIDRRYRNWVKKQGCVLTPPPENGASACIMVDTVDAHHVKPVGGGIMGSKVSDRRCVGLCRLHHQMAEMYPGSHRDFLEAAIKRLNREYDALFPAKPKKERKKSPGLKSITVQCAACGKVEHVPVGKLSRFGAGLRYRCLKTGSLEVVRVA